MAKAKCIIKTVIVSGGSRGGARGARPPLFLDQTEARRTEKNFFEPPPLISWSGYPSPPYLKVWIRHWLFDTFKCRLSSGRTTCTIIHPRYEEVSL